MNTDTDDIDVLAKPSPIQGGARVIADDAKILPPLSSICDCELVVNESGSAMVLFNKTLSEGIHWIEYDVDLSSLTFVTWSGDMMGLGMKVHAPFRKYLKKAKEIMMVEMSKDGQVVVAYPAELVIRHIGI